MGKRTNRKIVTVLSCSGSDLPSSDLLGSDLPSSDLLGSYLPSSLLVEIFQLQVWEIVIWVFKPNLQNPRFQALVSQY